MGLLQDSAHVFHVEVANVRAEHWVQGRAVRVHPAIESGGGRAVVALAAEEKVGYEKISDVLGACDLALAPVIQFLHAIAEYHVLDDLVAVRLQALVSKFIDEPA